MVKGINHITVSVRDVSRSFKFYTEVLGFSPIAKWKNGAYLLCGELWYCLSSDVNTRTRLPLEYTHLAFSIDPNDFTQIMKRLAEFQVVRWKENTSEGESLYISDPDGHKLELHVGSLESRLAACKREPYEDMEFFVWKR
jgi:catechol 2,3-dioxygenase-like lactoylglutathione lyase family enzyme